MGSSPDVPFCFTVNRNVQGGHQRFSCVVHCFVNVCEGYMTGFALLFSVL